LRITHIIILDFNTIVEMQKHYDVEVSLLFILGGQTNPP
jgi:hypothetical protein